MSNTSPLANLCVVLVEPTLPENVGAVARAMNNMGASELRLVNPCDHLGKSALRVAAHSEGVLHAARVYSGLSAAVSDAQQVIGFTARRRDRLGDPVQLPEFGGFEGSNRVSRALVFGRESSGLSNAELACCDCLVQIPTPGPAPSLNLAQAVVVALYEFVREKSRTDQTPPSAGAAAGEVEGFKRHLFEVLRLVGFLREHQRAALWQRFSEVIARAQMGSADLRLLRGFLRRIENRIHRLESKEGLPGRHGKSSRG